MPVSDDLAIMILSRWSVAVQLAVVLLLTVFFAVLSRTVKLQEVRLWSGAWVADAVALATVFPSAFLGVHVPGGRVWLVVYAAAKTSYALMLVAGTRFHVEPGADPPTRRWAAAAVVAVWSLAVGLLTPRFAHAQVAQSLMVGGILCYGAVWVLLHPRTPRSRWLGWALLVEGVLFLHYVPMLLPLVWGGAPLAPYLAYSSFLDAGGELLLALATLVALEASSNEHLRRLNHELELSQERLRQLVDLDPLTKLANRRGLRAELQRVRPLGAAVIFVDLDSFKTINDRYGHPVGDLTLVRVAEVITRSFRAEDAVFRCGGDEFLVIAPGMDRDSAAERVEAFRNELSRHVDGTPPVAVSAGIALLQPGGEPDAAIHEADRNMYANKQRRDDRQPTPITAA